MTIEVRVPQLPESVADATLVSWHKKPGDAVARDENLVDLETDKVVLEVPAPAAGVLKEIKLSDGTTVTSGQVLAVIEEGATALPGASAPAIMTSSGGAATAAADAVKADAVKPSTAAKPEPPVKSDPASAKLSPAAKRVVEENKVDPKAVAGSGRDGRVSKSDVVITCPPRKAPPAPAAKAPAGKVPAASPLKRAQRARRATRADDAAARADRRAHGAGASHASLADLVQRGGSESRQ